MQPMFFRRILFSLPPFSRYYVCVYLPILFFPTSPFPSSSSPPPPLSKRKREKVFLSHLSLLPLSVRSIDAWHAYGRRDGRRKVRSSPFSNAPQNHLGRYLVFPFPLFPAQEKGEKRENVFRPCGKRDCARKGGRRRRRRIKRREWLEQTVWEICKPPPSSPTHQEEPAWMTAGGGLAKKARGRIDKRREKSEKPQFARSTSLANPTLVDVAQFRLF